MRKAKIKYGGKVEYIEISDEIYNVYMEMEEEAREELEEFDRRVAEIPPHMNRLEAFLEAASETMTDGGVNKEISYGFFNQKGEELFGFNLDDVFLEFKIPREEGVDISVEFLKENT